MTSKTLPGAASERSSAASLRSQRSLRRIRRIIAYAVLIALSVVFAIPFLWLISTSLKPPEQLFRLPPEWIPNPVTWSNYPRAMTQIPFALYLKNTLYIALFNVVASVVSCSLVAYGFARIPWPGRNFMFLVLVSTLMIPFPVTLIPTFLIFRDLGWINTPHPLTVPALTGNAFFIFLLRQFYLTIPEELSSAARIDGASELQIYLRIILPLARPALAVVALFTFMANWNDFLGPLIYLSDREQYTLAIGLYGFLSRVRTDWGPLMAAATTMVAPIVALFFLTQRTFIQGITLTGIKG
ncbi:MAG: carbohydrate ABC transporter permease [Chloroflexota bacterium]|nr:MAG: sugar ABC transporter ATP-binding protein [Chloroflexota bacterium]